MIETRSNKKIILLGISVISFLLFYTIFSDRGILKVRELTVERDSIKSMAGKLEVENVRMETGINELNDDLKVIEKAARSELDLVRKDEILYKFSD